MTRQFDTSANNHWENHWQHPKYRRISMEQAISIALQRVPGHVVEAELEMDQGMLYYEIDIRSMEGIKYEVKVDAQTGNIIRVKID